MDSCFCLKDMDYIALEKSRLFSIRKRCGVLKYFLQNFDYTWYSYDGLQKYDFVTDIELRKLIDLWNGILEEIEFNSNDHSHCELAIHMNEVDKFEVYVQLDDGSGVRVIETLLLNDKEVGEALSIFARVGTFNTEGEWIWI